ncbi:hypothetical protein [Novosphingobium resinovorum]|uniref:hypothetical protein n=1 Tax=Novosphingobium resinovorum TaxID=158500 RepID=UPI001F32DE79|nr:hypothetical protein [Novosphingobium resinovorum]
MRLDRLGGGDARREFLARQVGHRYRRAGGYERGGGVETLDVLCRHFEREGSNQIQHGG